MERNKREERRHTWGSGLSPVWPKCGAYDREEVVIVKYTQWVEVSSQ